MVFALPAANAPPTRVTTSTRMDGRPRCASSIVGIVVTSSSSMIRGLVSANSDRATTRAERRPAATGSASVAGVTRSPPAFRCPAPAPRRFRQCCCCRRRAPPPQCRRPRAYRGRGGPVGQRLGASGAGRGREAGGGRGRRCRPGDRGDRPSPAKRLMPGHRVRPTEDEVHHGHDHDEPAERQDQCHNLRTEGIVRQHLPRESRPPGGTQFTDHLGPVRVGQADFEGRSIRSRLTARASDSSSFSHLDEQGHSRDHIRQQHQHPQLGPSRAAGPR